MSEGWAPAFGAQVDATGVRFTVCAPTAREVAVVLEDGATRPLAKDGEDTFVGHVAGAGVGTRYRFHVDGHGPWPDPCARWQPDGVHGPSMVVDPQAYAWTDGEWRGVARPRLVVYELHVGTFTPEGTFAAAAARLPYLRELGVTAIELMPIAAFPGTRNWGYDGAALFAPSERYGTPDALRAFVDAAHGLGLAVLLDVVYNHLGPDGAYLAAFMPTIFTDRHQSPWGRGINLDGPGCAAVRRLICDNALHWLLEYHMDGLRLDATHALADDSPEHILAQLSREVSAHVRDREVHLIAEDERNLDWLVLPGKDGGAGLTGVWADDFHHATRRHLAGDHEAWYSDFEGTTEEIARAIGDGWIFSGQHAAHYAGPRGTATTRVPIEAPVICLQNHDQVGNRAHGDRLHHQVPLGTWLAASALLLTAPETPMLFMGQEWAASTPFLYFTDHAPDLGALVVEGRRNEFRRFSAFSDPATRDLIPSPQGTDTFAASVLRWEEALQAPHAHVLTQTRDLLAIRHAHLRQPRDRTRVRSEAAGPHAVWIAQPSALGGLLVTLADFSGTGAHRVAIGDLLSGTASLERLYETRPTPDDVLVRDVRLDGNALVIDAANQPFAIVLHVTGGLA